MDAGNGKHLLKPDYAKSAVEMYRDLVEAAFLDQRSSDVLLYISGSESPSWIRQGEKIEAADEGDLVHKFVAYLRLALDEDVYRKYVAPQMSDAARDVDGHVFGKPVWDFEYPASSFLLLPAGSSDALLASRSLKTRVSSRWGARIPSCCAAVEIIIFSKAIFTSIA
jgi:hypothetical protein